MANQNINNNVNNNINVDDMNDEDPSVDDDHLVIILNPQDNPKNDPIAGQPNTYHRKYLKYKMKYLNLLNLSNLSNLSNLLNR